MKNIGYKTHAFLPIPPTYNWDEKLFDLIGLQQTVAEKTTASVDNWQTKFNQDKASLIQLKQQISNWIDNEQRYAAIFLPQVGIKFHKV